MTVEVTATYTTRTVTEHGSCYSAAVSMDDCELSRRISREIFHHHSFSFLHYIWFQIKNTAGKMGTLGTKLVGPQGSLSSYSFEMQ